MIYDLFIEFCGVPEELLASSPTLQKCFAAGAFGLAVVGIALLVYMFLVIFRGWK